MATIQQLFYNISFKKNKTKHTHAQKSTPLIKLKSLAEIYFGKTQKNATTKNKGNKLFSRKCKDIILPNTLNPEICSKILHCFV